MRLALAQINTTVGDLPGNCARLRTAYDRAVQAARDFVLAPELAVTGYPPRDLLAKRRFVDDNLQALAELARQIGSVPLLAGYVDHHRQRPGRPSYNAAALLQNGQIVTRRFKTLLPTYDVFDEDRYFQPAAENQVVPWQDARLGITICEDIWAEEYLPAPLYQRNPVRALLAGPQPATLLLNLSASPFHLGKTRTRCEMLQHLARRYHVPIAYCNLVGGNDELIFDGNSLVVDAAGHLLAHGAAFQEDLVIVDLAAGPASPPPAGDAPDEIAALHAALVLGLRDYACKCGFSSVVLGLSGGIDSAVTACLAVEAFGPANVLGVSMPSRFSSDGSVTDARQLAANLGMRWELIPIREIVTQFNQTLAGPFQGLPEDTTEENIQARIRGNLLMALSNKFGHMLLTTGNKSELAVGYCTLYGDMCGGLAVIADVPKTLVYRLAHDLNRQRELIPTASITKPPSAELRPNQTDQDSLPPYEVLDVILKHYVEDQQSAAEIVTATGLSEEVVREIVRKIDLNEYKRKQAPPCLRVTTKAFGIGRRVPIAQRYVER